MTNFEKIKQFFIDHMGKFVSYQIRSPKEILDTSYPNEYVCQHFKNNPAVRDYFAIKFPHSIHEDKELVHIDSLDSFVFDFYFVEYISGSIEINDAERTFQCGVEAYEGNGVLATKHDVVKKYLQKYNIKDGGALYKNTTIHTFIEDTITFTKVLQTLNNIQPYPPYILELEEAKEVEEVLTRCWVNNENMTDNNKGEMLNVFDNHKQEYGQYSTTEHGYPVHYNKHKFVGVFFNEDGKVLVRKNLKDEGKKYDFSIYGYVLYNETFSLEAMQRAIHDTFGYEFWFGEVGPAITTLLHKTITDYYIVDDYNVSIDEINYDKEQYIIEWMTYDEVMALVKAQNFSDYTTTFVDYIYEMKEKIKQKNY